MFGSQNDSVSHWDNEMSGIYFFKDIIYLLQERGGEREREHTQAGVSAGRGRSRLSVNKEPDIGLNTRTLAS